MYSPNTFILNLFRSICCGVCVCSNNDCINIYHVMWAFSKTEGKQTVLKKPASKTDVLKMAMRGGVLDPYFVASVFNVWVHIVKLQ